MMNSNENIFTKEVETEIYNKVMEIIDETGGMDELIITEDLVSSIVEKLAVKFTKDFPIGIHITHIDADGVGCGVVFNTAVYSAYKVLGKNLFSDEVDTNLVTFCVGERVSTDMLRLILTVFKIVSIYIWKDDDYITNYFSMNRRFFIKYYPDFLCMSDVNLNPYKFYKTFVKLYGDDVKLTSIFDGLLGWYYYGDIFFDNNDSPEDREKFHEFLRRKNPQKIHESGDSIGFLYIDHHSTNSMLVKQDANATGDVGYEEFKERLNKLSIIKTKKRSDGSFASATLLMAMFPLFDEYFERCHVLNDIYEFANDISQWDTFGWRDCPKFNTGHEFDVMFLSYIYSPNELIDILSKEFYQFIDYSIGDNNDKPFFDHFDLCEKFGSDERPIFPPLIYPDMVSPVYFYNNPELIKLLEVSKNEYEKVLSWYLNERNGVWIYMDFRGKRVATLIVPAPEKYISIIVHNMMESRKDYHDMEKENDNVMVLGFFIKTGTISLRTRSNNFSVAEMSKELFNGGGHPQAAGGKPSMPEFVNIVTKYIMEMK